MSEVLPNIDSDQPLCAADAMAHDKLQRKGFVEAAVAALKRVSSSAGFVLSIEGPWGSGKTSTLAMMEQLIRLQSGQESIVVHFNPWLVGERDALLRQFLTSIAAAIELKDRAAEAKEVSRELLNYADVFDFVKWVPGAEPWASIVKGVLKSSGKATGKVADQKARDIEGQKDRLEKALARLDKKIYVFIDDVDRLVPSEVFERVRIIKAVGHLPNVGYVVAWEPEYIHRSLKAGSIPRAAAYIDKIVQVRLPVPAISAHARLQLLNDGIASLANEATLDYFPRQDERLQSLYFNGLRDLLEHPRDVTRVMNTLSVIEPGLRGEIVFADLLGLACLMVRAPRVFDALRREPGLFTGGSYTDDAQKGQEKHRSIMERIYAKSPNPDAVKKMVHHLFPAAARASGHSMMGRAIDVEGHIGASSRLSIAISMAVGVTDVSLVDARQYLLQPAKRSDIEAKLTPENCLGFMEMLGQVAEKTSKLERPSLGELCLAIARLVDRPPLSNSENRQRFFMLPAETLAVHAIMKLVEISGGQHGLEVALALSHDEESLSVAAEIINDSLVNSEGESALIIGSLAKRKSAGNSLANNTVQAIRSDTLWQRSNPSRILWTIMRAAPKLAKKVFAELKLKDPTLDCFALHFLKHAYSSDGGQSYSLPDDVAVNNMVNKRTLVAHAKKRLDDKKLDYPARAAWQSVVDGMALYGSSGADARM